MKKLVLVLTCFMSISSAFAMDCHIKAERLARYATMEEESGRGGQPYNVIQAARDLKHFDFEYQYAGTKDFVSGLDHKAIHHVLVTDKKTKELKYKWEVVTANPVECHTLSLTNITPNEQGDRLTDDVISIDISPSEKVRYTFIDAGAQSYATVYFSENENGIDSMAFNFDDPSYYFRMTLKRGETEVSCFFDG